MEKNFDTLAREFVKELSEVFPEEKTFSSCLKHFDTYDSKKFFVDVFGPHRALIVAKDDRLFDEIRIPNVDAKALWNGISETTKEAIWAYGSTMTMLVSAIENTPKELMNNIETLAQEFSEKMENGELDMNALFGEVMQSVQKMDLSSMKDMDINALTQSMGIDPSMIAGALGNVDPSMIQNMMGLMSGGGEEEDLLKLLETAQRPPLPTRKKSSKKKSSKKRNK